MNDVRLNERVISILEKLVDDCSDITDVEVVSLIVFGLKARSSITFTNSYDILILLDDSVTVTQYIRFSELIKLNLLKNKLTELRVAVFTPEAFSDLLYKDDTLGTYLYMIATDSHIVYDSKGTFTHISQCLLHYPGKSEEVFIKQCIEFSKEFNSRKWQLYWEKALLRLRSRYDNKRRRKI